MRAESCQPQAISTKWNIDSIKIETSNKSNSKKLEIKTKKGIQNRFTLPKCDHSEEFIVGVKSYAHNYSKKFP